MHVWEKMHSRLKLPWNTNLFWENGLPLPRLSASNSGLRKQLKNECLMTLTNTVAHKSHLICRASWTSDYGLRSLSSQPSISVLRIIASSLYRPG